MPPVISTSETHSENDVLGYIVVKDAFTLLFVLSTPVVREATTSSSSSGKCGTAGSSFSQSVAFTSPETVLSSSARSTGFSADASAREPAEGREPLKEYFWKNARADITPPRGELLHSHKQRCRGAESLGESCCPCCQQNSTTDTAKSDYRISSNNNTSSEGTLPSEQCGNSSDKESQASLPILSGAFAELRATELVATPNISTADGTHSCIIALHVVRECCEDNLADVWCIFACGCSALVTFQLSRKDTEKAVVKLQSCVWVPRLAETAEGKREAKKDFCGEAAGSDRSCGDPRAGWYLSEAATTASVSLLNMSPTNSNLKVLEMVLVTPYRAVGSAAPALHYVNLRRAAPASRDTPSTALKGLNKVAHAQLEPWQLHEQGWLDMRSLFCVPPSLREPAQRQDQQQEQRRHYGAPPHHSGGTLRSIRFRPPGALRWRDNELDFFVLCAVPAVALGDPCLDTLTYCTITVDRPASKESGSGGSRGVDEGREGTTGEAANSGLSVASPSWARVSGRVSAARWSVRALTLAHPSFLFTHVLPAVRHNKLDRSTVEVPEVVHHPSSKAAAFRNARLAIAHTDSYVCGVFQRPAQVPYAASRLFRAAAALAAPQKPLSTPTQQQRQGEDGKDSTSGFAFVLFNMSGEEARCALDGYVECANTVVLRRGSQICDEDSLLASPSQQAVARVCVLLAAPGTATASSRFHCGGATTISAEEREEGCVETPTAVVVMTVFAQQRRDGTSSSTKAAAGAVNAAAGRGREGKGEFATTAASSMRGDRVLSQFQYAVQLTQRISLDVAPPTFAAVGGLRASVVTTERILCWGIYTAQPSAQDSAGESSKPIYRGEGEGEVWVTVCGYVAASASTEDVAGDVYSGIIHLANASRSLRGEGVREAKVLTADSTCQQKLSLSPSPASSSPTHSSGLRHFDNDTGTQCVRAASFAHSLLSCQSVDSTRLDLLSHTPPAKFHLHPPLHVRGARNVSVNLPTDLLPVALTWLPQVSADAVGASATTLPNDAVSCAEAALAQCVSELDVIALLRCGVVVGWRCREGSESRAEPPQVRQLGVLRCPALSKKSPVQDTTTTMAFLQKLLNAGAGPELVRMRVVVSAAAAPVLLVIAVGPFLGVVRLRSGHVEHVLDMRAAWTQVSSKNHSVDASAVAAAAGFTHANASVSVVDLQQLPLVTPHAVMPCAEGVRGIGSAFSFTWTGVATLFKTSQGSKVGGSASSTATAQSLNAQPAGAEATSSLMTCVVQLGVISWADVSASLARGAGVAQNSSSSGGLHQGSKLSLDARSDTPSAVPAAAATGTRTALPAETAGGNYGVLTNAIASSSASPPIVILHVCTSWCNANTPFGGTGDSATRPSALSAAAPCCPLLSWFGAVECRGEANCIEEHRDGGSAASAATTTAAAAATLCVCDAALLQALWPGSFSLSSAHQRNGCDNTEASGKDSRSHQVREVPPLRCLRWSAAVTPHARGAAQAPASATSASPAAGLDAGEAAARKLFRYPIDVSSSLLLSKSRSSVDVVMSQALRLNGDVASTSPVTTFEAREKEDHLLEDRSGVGVSGFDWMNCRFKQILFLAPLLDAAAVQPVCSEKSNLPRTLRPSVTRSSCLTMCTVAYEVSEDAGGGAAPRPATTSAHRVASFLVCCVPPDSFRRNLAAASTPDNAGAVVDGDSGGEVGRCTWHWMPLPPVSVVSAGKDVCAAGATLGVSRVLPLHAPPDTASTAHIAANHARGANVVGAMEVYCEGAIVSSNTPVCATPAFVKGRLFIHWNELWSALTKETMKTTGAASSDMHKVFAHTTVDSTLICWRGVQLL